MVMFGFLIALPGGRKKNKRGWRGGQSRRARRAVLHSFLTPCYGEGPCEPHAPASPSLLPGGHREGPRAAKLLLPCSFLLQGCAKTWRKKHPERGTRGCKHPWGGGVITETCGVLGSLPPPWQAPPSCPHTCWRCGHDATALPAVHGSCLEQGRLLLLRPHSTH